MSAIYPNYNALPDPKKSINEVRNYLKATVHIVTDYSTKRFYSSDNFNYVFRFAEDYDIFQFGTFTAVRFIGLDSLYFTGTDSLLSWNEIKTFYYQIDQIFYTLTNVYNSLKTSSNEIIQSFLTNFVVYIVIYNVSLVLIFFAYYNPLLIDEGKILTHLKKMMNIIPSEF